MNKKIEIGIAGGGLNASSLSWIESLALALSLRGVVFTKPDGSIKVTAEGEELALQQFVNKIEKGNIFSSMDNFYVHWSEAQEKRFYVLTRA